jgi:hypothetical protein
MQQFVAGPAQFRRTFGLRAPIVVDFAGLYFGSVLEPSLRAKSTQFKVVRPTPAQKQVG